MNKMNSCASTETKKRKRASDNPSKSEPVAKKARRNKSAKVEKDPPIDTRSTKSKSSKDARRKNFSKKNQSYFQSEKNTDYEINNNIKAQNEISLKTGKKEVFELSSKIINSEAFKKLRDLRVLLDRSLADSYLRKKSASKKSNPPSGKRKRVRRSKHSKVVDGTENHGQKTLFHFFDTNKLSGQSPAINIKPVLPKKCEYSGWLKNSSQLEDMKDVRVNISVKDLLMLCNVKVDLEMLHPIDCLTTDQVIVSRTNDHIISSNGNQCFDYYNPEWNFARTPDDVSIDESLAKIKIEDVSPSIDEHSMKMEVSDESLSPMNYSWNEDYQPCFEAFEMERMSKMKLTDALSALSSDDRLLIFYDECPDVPMEEICPPQMKEEVTVKQETVEKALDPFVNFVNSTSNTSCSNSSRYSFPVSDESGIFMSDDSTNEPSSKLMVNASFDGMGNEPNSIQENS